MLRFHPVDHGRWADLEKLFAGKGGPKNCWCMVWRAEGEEARRTDGPSRKAGLRKRVEGGVPIGLLGYDGDEPVAWVSIAPRATYRNLGGPAVAEGEDPDAVWSVACFYLRADHRGQGAFHEMLQAAIDHARKKGAKVLEAYPVQPDSPSYRFMGFVPSFEEAGFEACGNAGVRRHVMRLTL